jgi:hypothetical protein
MQGHCIKSCYSLKFLETKFWSFTIWAASRKRIYFLKFNLMFFGTCELYFSQAFWQHQARSIPTPYEPVVNFCSKSLENVIFFNFLGALS